MPKRKSPPAFVKDKEGNPLPLNRAARQVIAKRLRVPLFIIKPVNTPIHQDEDMTYFREDGTTYTPRRVEWS